MTSPTSPPAPFLLRVFLTPVHPGLWRAAAGMTLAQVLVPVLLLAFLASTTLGVMRGFGMRRWLHEVAEAYDASFDPIVYEEGELRVDGPRLPRWSDGESTLLVDPGETTALADIDTPTACIVRADRIVLRRPYQPEQEAMLSEMEGVIGRGPVRVDSAWLRGQAEEWSATLGLGLGLLLGVIGVVVDGGTCVAYSLLAAAIVAKLRDVAYGPALRAALAASGGTIMLGFLLHLAGAGLPCACVTGPVLWTGLIAGAAAFALRGSRTGVPSP